MATATASDVRLTYERSGAGEVALVLVHGSRVSRRESDRVVPGLVASLRALTYDRRGHSESERPTGQGGAPRGRRRSRDVDRPPRVRADVGGRERVRRVDDGFHRQAREECDV